MDTEVWRTAAECEDIDMNYELNALDLVQETLVIGGVMFTEENWKERVAAGRENGPGMVERGAFSLCGYDNS